MKKKEAKEKRRVITAKCVILIFILSALIVFSIEMIFSDVYTPDSLIKSFVEKENITAKTNWTGTVFSIFIIAALLIGITVYIKMNKYSYM